jgi:hypothetical protein
MSDSVGGVCYVIRHWFKKADTQRPKCKDRNVLKPFYPNHQFKVCLTKVKCRGMAVGTCRFRLPCGLRRNFAAAWSVGSRVRVPLSAWMFACCVCCVLYGCWSIVQRTPTKCACVCVCVCVCLIVCDLETLKRGNPGPILTVSPQERETKTVCT